jgi:hypothetical protein
VVVALVVVLLSPVKFCNVVDPRVRMLAKVPRPELVKLPPLACVKKRLVEDAVVEKRLVDVALPNVTVPRFALVE